MFYSLSHVSLICISKSELVNTMCGEAALHTSHLEPQPVGLGQRALPLLTSQ